MGTAFEILLVPDAAALLGRSFLACMWRQRCVSFRRITFCWRASAKKNCHCYAREPHLFSRHTLFYHIALVCQGGGRSQQSYMRLSHSCVGQRLRLFGGMRLLVILSSQKIIWDR